MSVLTRTKFWAIYWWCITASLVLAFGIAVALEATGGDHSGTYWFLRFVFTFLATSFPFLWLVVGSPPGYTALHHYWSRLGPGRGSEDSTTPSVARTGFELLSATAIVCSIPAIILFSEPQGERRGRGVIARFVRGDMAPRTESTAEALGLVSNPTPFFLLAVFGLSFAAVSWFVLWVVR